MIDVPADLMALLRQEEADSVDTELDEARANALDYYHGRPFGDEEEGLSQVVTRDVAEAVDYMAVSILRTVVSGDKVVEFDGETPEDDESAAEASEAISLQFMRASGYRKLHDWLKAGLLERVGVMKTWAEPQSRVVDMEVGVDTLADMEVSTLAYAEPVDPTELMWRVGVKEELPAKFCDEAVPGEEFKVSRDARTLDDATYLAHVTPKRLSDLTAMGFDVEEVDRAWGANPDSQVVSQARDGRPSNDAKGYNEGPNRRVWLREEYVLFDMDGDGMVERLCIHRVGDTILSVKEVDDQPFVIWSPFPMAHRLIGQSLADKTMDVQRVRSVLRRQLLDNLYLSNRPRTLINEQSLGENTIDDLLTVRPDAIIRYKGNGADSVPRPYAVPFVAGPAMQMDEILIGERESRTGITRLNQGLDADALNKTATGTAMMQATGQQMEEYNARNFCEGVAELFVKKAKLYRNHGSPMRVRIDGEFRQVDPAKWGNFYARVSVGLGSGRKDQRVQSRMMLLELQKEALAAELPIVDQKKLYNSVKGLVADTALGNVNDYFNDPDMLPPQQEGEEPPTPEMMKAQADAMMRAEELTAKREDAMLATELKREENAARIELMREEAAARLELDRQRFEAEAALAREKMDREWALAVDQREREASDKRIRDATMRDNRPGGSLAA